MQLEISREYLYRGLVVLPDQFGELIIELNQYGKNYDEDIEDLFSNILRDYKAIIEDQLLDTKIPEVFATEQRLIKHVYEWKKILEKDKIKFQNIKNYRNDWRINNANTLIDKTLDILSKFLTLSQKEQKGFLFEKDGQTIELKKITFLDLIRTLPRLTFGSWSILIGIVSAIFYMGIYYKIYIDKEVKIVSKKSNDYNLSDKNIIHKF